MSGLELMDFSIPHEGTSEALRRITRAAPKAARLRGRRPHPDERYFSANRGTGSP